MKMKMKKMEMNMMMMKIARITFESKLEKTFDINKCIDKNAFIRIADICDANIEYFNFKTYIRCT